MDNSKKSGMMNSAMNPIEKEVDGVVSESEARMGSISGENGVHQTKDAERMTYDGTPSSYPSGVPQNNGGHGYANKGSVTPFRSAKNVNTLPDVGRPVYEGVEAPSGKGVMFKVETHAHNDRDVYSRPQVPQSSAVISGEPSIKSPNYNRAKIPGMAVTDSQFENQSRTAEKMKDDDLAGRATGPAKEQGRKGAKIAM